MITLVCFGVRYAKALAEPGIDFWRPWAVTSLLRSPQPLDVYSRAGRENVYRLAALPQMQSTGLPSREKIAARRNGRSDAGFLGYRGIDIVHTPFLLAFVRLFTFPSYECAYWAYAFVSLLCFFLGSYLISRLVGFSVPASLVITGVIALVSKPEIGEMVSANINNFQLLLIAIFLCLQKTARKWSDIVSGILLTFAVALKPNVAIILLALGVVWVGGRMWGKILRVAIGGVAGIGLVFAATTLLVGQITWSDWCQVLPQVMRSEQAAKVGNISLAAIIAHSYGIDLSRVFFGVGGAALAVAAFRSFWRGIGRVKDADETRTFLGVSAGALLMLLTPRLVWGHYAVLALPPMIYLAGKATEGGRSRGLIIALMLFVFTTFASSILQAAGVSIVFQSLIWDMILIVMFGWVLCDLWNVDYPSKGFHHRAAERFPDRRREEANYFPPKNLRKD